MSEQATLLLTHDGRSNVLRICRGAASGVMSVVLDFCKHLPTNKHVADVDRLNRHSMIHNRFAQSTDFVCTHSNCSYHHQSASRYILHARSHFDFEVTPDAVYDTEFKWRNGKYTCSKCPRSTVDWISFREHIRHHVLESPYKCSLCMTAVTSVRELRLHFQECHRGEQADFVFNGSVFELNTLLSTLLPESSAVTEPVSVTLKVPANTRTRIAFTSALNKTKPVGLILMRDLIRDLDDNARKLRAQEQESDGNALDKSHPVEFVRDLDDNQRSPRATREEADRSAFLDDGPVVKQMPGKYEYSHGLYRCITCCYKTVKEKVFARHAWKHVHGSWKSTCVHNTKSASSSECAIVNGLLELLKRVDLASVVDNSRQDSVYRTESGAHHRTTGSVENISSIVSAENNDNYLSLPDVVQRVQPSVSVETDSPVHDMESDQEDDVTEKPDSEEIVVIRHDEIPLKAHCKQCSFTCNDASQLALHMKTGHNSAPCKPGNFKCPKCNMSLPKKEVYFWHLSHHTGNHSVMYYTCSGCDAEKPSASELQKHIARKHFGERSRCTPVALVENVRYLQNIMKCPVCTDGLLWKQIFIKHIQDKHDLSDLAGYLSVNYGDDCPDVLSFPRHLLKCSAKKTTESVTEVAESFRTLPVNRVHRHKREFSTSDSHASSQHENSRSQSRTESSEENVMSAVSSNVLFNREKPHRTAKMKAYSRIITPPLRQQQIRSSKREFDKIRQQPVARKRTTTSSEENNWPSVSRTKNAAVASEKVVKKPTSANDNDFFTEFINKLPSSYVFAEDVKCPRCYFVSRVRVNLLRHLKSHMIADDKTADSASGSSGSNDRLSYNLWQPGSSAPSEKSAEEEPVETVMSEARNADDSESNLMSPNSTDDASEEQLTTAEVDSLSQSESDIANDDADNASVQTEMLACETCSSQFDSEVDLEQHISVSHGGPYVCHLCGILMWQQNVVRAHYSARHPGSPLLFERLQKKADDSSREVGGVSERKIARVQGIMKETQWTEFSDTTPEVSSRQKEPDTCNDVTDTGILPSSSSAVSAAPSASETSVSEASAALPSDAPATATPSFTVTSTSQVPLNSSGFSTTSMPALSTLPIPLDSLLATLGNMESIAMIAAQLVPLLANMDARLLMQMLQVANPALAAAFSAYCTPPAVASDLGQVPATSCQTESSTMQFQLPSSTGGTFSSAMLQNQTSVCDSSTGRPVVASQSADCNRTVSGDSFQTTDISSSESSLAVGSTAALADTAPSDSQFEQRYASSSPNALHRPQSMGSTSSSMYSTDKQLEVDIVPPVVYNCHLCSFRSSHKTRFAEHLSSEFCTKNIMEMSKRTLDGEPSRCKRCSHCSFSTYLSEEFDEHVRIHMSSDLHCCAYCDYVGPSTGALKLHFKRNHQKKSFPENLVGQKSHGDHHTDDQPNMPLPESIHLDPVVEMYNVVTLDRSDVKRLKNQYGVAKINLCGL